MSVAGDEPTAGVNVSECPKTVVTLARISSQDDRTAPVSYEAAGGRHLGAFPRA
jgi:hypothetical protein